MAVKNDISAFEYAGCKYMANSQITLLTPETGDIFQYVDFTLRNDNEFMLKAMKIDGQTLMHPSDRLKRNTDVVMAGVPNRGANSV